MSKLSLPLVDSAIMSSIEILIWTLVQRGHLAREDVENWLENMRIHGEETISNPKTDGAAVLMLAERYRKSFFGDEGTPRKTLH